MSEILVTIYVLTIGQQFDLKIPIGILMSECLDMIQNTICELTNNVYEKNADAMLYDDEGNIINLKNVVKYSGIKNGSKLLLK